MDLSVTWGTMSIPYFFRCNLQYSLSTLLAISSAWRPTSLALRSMSFVPAWIHSNAWSNYDPRSLPRIVVEGWCTEKEVEAGPDQRWWLDGVCTYNVQHNVSHTNSLPVSSTSSPIVCRCLWARNREFFNKWVREAANNKNEGLEEIQWFSVKIFVYVPCKPWWQGMPYICYTSRRPC